MKTNSIVDLTSGAIQTAITEYTHWHHTLAVGFLILSVLAIVICGYIIAKMIKIGSDQIEAYIICGIIALVAIVLLPFNIATISSPKAYAIHQLIEDLRN